MPFTNENEFQTFPHSMEILMCPSMQALNWPKEASRVVKQVQALALIHDNNSFKGQLVLESHKALGDFVMFCLGFGGLFAGENITKLLLSCFFCKWTDPSMGNAVPSQHSL